MVIPKEKIDQLIKELEQLEEQDAEQAVVVIEDFLKTRKYKKMKPSEFRGILKHLNFDAEEESKKIREEWNREWD